MLPTLLHTKHYSLLLFRFIIHDGVKISAIYVKACRTKGKLIYPDQKKRKKPALPCTVTTRAHLSAENVQLNNVARSIQITRIGTVASLSLCYPSAGIHT